MKPSEVYTKAAELIASGELKYACAAISCAMNFKDHNDRIISFEKNFKPERSPFLSNWFGEFTPENQRARELALYLMAEIAKDFE